MSVRVSHNSQQNSRVAYAALFYVAGISGLMTDSGHNSVFSNDVTLTRDSFYRG